MEYEGQICRAPMERASFMLPVAVGCSYGGCRFCMLFRMDATVTNIAEKSDEELYDGFHDMIQVRIRGSLPRDREKMLAKLDKTIGNRAHLQPVYAFVE